MLITLLGVRVCERDLERGIRKARRENKKIKEPRRAVTIYRSKVIR